MSLPLFAQNASQEQLAKAERAIDLKAYPTALALLQELAAKEPANYRVLFDIAYVYSVTGERAKAIETYRKTLAIRPDLTQAGMNLAILLLEDKQGAEAAKLLTTVAAARPKDVRAQSLLANALADSGQSDEAIEQYRKVLDLDPQSFEACFALGRLLEKQQRYPEAERQFTRALELQPDDVAAGIEMARLFELTGRQEQALKRYSELARKAPGESVVRRRFGELLLVNKQFAEAAVQFEAAARMGLPPRQDKLNLARAYAGAKQPARAVPVLRALADTEPGDYEAHLLLGEMLSSTRDFAAARQELEAAARLRPDVPDAYVDLANVLYLQNDLPGTLQALDRVAAMGRKSTWFYFLRAITLDKLGELEPALDSYQQFLGVAKGEYPDQEFQARQRIKAIKLEMEKAGRRRKR